MTPVQAVSTVFRKYATFSGVASRPEYWWFTLFYSVVTGVLSALQGDAQNPNMAAVGISFIWSLGVLLPALAVTVRRFHDAGFSGKWLLLWLVAVVFFVVSIGQTISAGFFAAAPITPSTDVGGQLLAAAGTLLASSGLFFAVGIFQLIVTIRPSKSAEEGNKYA